MAKIKFSIECDLHGLNPSLLWPLLTTPEGLEQWFADEVLQEGKIFTFVWDNVPMQASLASIQPMTRVRYRWLDSDGAESKPGYFELKVTQSEFSGHRTLVITDFADSEDDVEEMTRLWDDNLHLLRRCLGLQK